MVPKNRQGGLEATLTPPTYRHIQQYHCTHTRGKSHVSAADLGKVRASMTWREEQTSRQTAPLMLISGTSKKLNTSLHTSSEDQSPRSDRKLRRETRGSKMPPPSSKNRSALSPQPVQTCERWECHVPDLERHPRHPSSAHICLHVGWDSMHPLTTRCFSAATQQGAGGWQRES